jgi:hypothetical protein
MHNAAVGGSHSSIPRSPHSNESAFNGVAPTTRQRRGESRVTPATLMHAAKASSRAQYTRFCGGNGVTSLLSSVVMCTGR